MAGNPIVAKLSDTRFVGYLSAFAPPSRFQQTDEAARTGLGTRNRGEALAPLSVRKETASTHELPTSVERRSLGIVPRKAKRNTWQKTARCFITPAAQRAWAACRAARRPTGGASPPTPRQSARGNSGRRSCRQQRRRIQEILHPPSKRWSRMSDRNERSARCRFRPSASIP